jgi:hypothetical protein
MADTYEHEKPYNLTGQYQETPAPSELGTPYDLHGAYDESAGDGGQYAGASGFNAQEFGQIAIVFNQTVKPTALDALSFSNPRIYNLRQYIQNVGSYVATGFGSPYVWNFNKEIKTTGFNGSSFSLPKIINKTQEVKPNGFLLNI